MHSVCEPLTSQLLKSSKLNISVLKIFSLESRGGGGGIHISSQNVSNATSLCVKVEGSIPVGTSEPSNESIKRFDIRGRFKDF